MCECVRARAGKRVVYVCVGREMEDRGFPCVCVRAHVCVGEADSAVCVCVCVGEGHEGWREGFPETEPQRICLGKKEILWFDFIF